MFWRRRNVWKGIVRRIEKPGTGNDVWIDLRASLILMDSKDFAQL